MLKCVFVDNFRCLVNFEMKFDRLSLILGANGSGKSTVFEAIQRVRDLVTNQKTVAETFPISTLTKWSKTPIQTFHLIFDEMGKEYEYRISIEHNVDRKLSRVSVETLNLNGKPLCELDRNGDVHLYRDNHSVGPIFPFDWSRSAVGTIASRHENKKLVKFREELLGRILVVSLYPRYIGVESDKEDSFLDPEGLNFANWYRFLSQEHQDKVFEATQKLREYVSGFRTFKLIQFGAEHRKLIASFSSDNDNDNSLDYDFNELSDGQRVMSILYTLSFATKGLQYTLLLDEPDNYVALQEIQPWLMELKDICDDGDSQAVIISHHPELIDYLASDCGIWIERIPNGASRIGALPKMEEGDMKLSERISRGWK